MERFKKIMGIILFPHIPIIITLTLISVIGLVYAFGYEEAHPAIVYAAYFISAYTLTIICARVPAVYRYVKQLGDENKYIGLYRSEAGLRVKISLYGSLVINVLYAFMQLVLGCIYHTIWYYSLAGYYALLVIMRFFLLRETRLERWGKDRRTELLLYRLCGVLLIPMNIALSVVVTYIVRQNRGFEHHYIVTIGMAAYTFTALTIAVVNMVRYRKYSSPVMSASKVISFVSVLVSVLSLETAMFIAFGDENDVALRKVITASSGAAVCFAVLVMAIVMIVKSTKEIRINKGGNLYEQR